MVGKEPGTWRINRRIAIVILATIIVTAIALAVLSVKALLGFGGPWVRISNNSGHPITKVTLRIDDLPEHRVRPWKSWTFDLIAPGEWEEVRGLTDSSITLIYVHGGSEQRYSEPYVDLWTSDTWNIRVGVDGTPTAGYFRPTRGEPD